MNSLAQDNLNTAEILLLAAHESLLVERNHLDLFDEKLSIKLIDEKLFSIECSLQFLNPNLVAPNDGKKFERNEVAVQVAKYRACDCPEHLRIGQTTVWCCNTCGLPDERVDTNLKMTPPQP
jgi:hypothetical protein